MTTNYKPPQSIYDESQNYIPRSVELFPTDALVETDVVNDTVPVAYTTEPDEKPTPVYIVNYNEFKFRKATFITYTVPINTDAAMQVVPNEYRSRKLTITNAGSQTILVGSEPSITPNNTIELEPNVVMVVECTNELWARSNTASVSKLSIICEREYDH